MKNMTKVLMVAGLAFCVLTSIALGERPAPKSVPSGGASRGVSPGFNRTFSSGARQGQSGDRGFRSTPEERTYSRSNPRDGSSRGIWDQSSDSVFNSRDRRVMKSDVFDNTRRSQDKSAKVSDGPRISRSSYSRERNMDSRFSRSAGRDVASRSHRDDHHGWSHDRHDGRDYWRHYHSGWRYYYPWWGWSVSYASDDLGIYIGTGWPTVTYTRVWVPGYWNIVYDTVEYYGPWGEVCYRSVPRRVWVSGYWSYRY